MALSLPPWGWWVLAFPGAALCVWAVSGAGALTGPGHANDARSASTGISLSLRRVREPLRGALRRASAGLACGLGLFVPGLWWSLHFNWYGAAVLMIAESLFITAAAALVPPGRAGIVALPGLMTVAEWLRWRWPFGGLPPGSVALGQVSSPLAGTARLGGEILIVFLVWVTGAGLLAILESAWPARWPGSLRRAVADSTGTIGQTDVAEDIGGSGNVRGIEARDGFAGERPEGGAARHRGPLFAAGVLTIVAVLGITFAAAYAPDGGRAVSHVRIAAVQGGGIRGDSALQVPAATVFNAAVAATERLLEEECRNGIAGHAVHDTEDGSAAVSPSEVTVARRPGATAGRHCTAASRRSNPDLVIWPEDTVAVDGPFTGSYEEAELSGFARSLHATLEAGVTRPVGVASGENFSVAIAPSGKVVSRYEKMHRVPFGEYVPFRSFFSHFANLNEVPRDAIPGKGPPILATPAGRLGMMISFEVFFPRQGRDAVRSGGRLLIVPTNTSSYAKSQMPGQELAAARLRAIEEGRDLVQAAPTGYSAVITNRGKVVEVSVLGRQQVLVGAVALRTGDTVYERTGDLPVLLLCLLLTVAGWVVDIRSRDETVAARNERRSVPNANGLVA